MITNSTKSFYTIEDQHKIHVKKPVVLKTFDAKFKLKNGFSFWLVSLELL